MRFSPLWWPALAIAAPLLAPWLAYRGARFSRQCAQAERVNRARVSLAQSLDPPELEGLVITVLAEAKARPGFIAQPGVCYHIASERGRALFDLGWGPERGGAAAANAATLGLDLNDLAAVVISHLHPDHMGGIKAARQKRVSPPPGLGLPRNPPLLLPAPARSTGFDARLAERPGLLPAGLASTGPLLRPLFFLGPCEEQALVARVRGKGAVVITGCGHPGLPLILAMAAKLCPGPLYALAGGLHLPLSASRFNSAGIKSQMILGTGLPPWRKLGKEHLEQTVAAINQADPQVVLLSPHDTCDAALDLLAKGVKADCRVLRAGERYRL